MLKKIENIAATAEFKNNSRFINSLHSLPGISSGKSGISDSLSFSSAFRYLSQLKWNLKSLEHNENDEFLLEFGIENLNFQTKVNIRDCHAENIIYKIINENVINLYSHKYQVLISFDFNSDVYIEPLITTDTIFLRKLFDKFTSYDSIILNNSISPEVNDFLLDELHNNVRYEISLIHRNLIVFVEKILGETFSKQLKFATFNPEKKLIRIQQINVKR